MSAHQMLPEFPDLIDRLSDLAAMWRGCYADEDQLKVIELEYEQIVQRLLNAGWDGRLEPEAYLPSWAMPEEYIRRFSYPDLNSDKWGNPNTD